MQKSFHKYMYFKLLLVFVFFICMTFTFGVKDYILKKVLNSLFAKYLHANNTLVTQISSKEYYIVHMYMFTRCI